MLAMVHQVVCPIPLQITSELTVRNLRGRVIVEVADGAVVIRPMPEKGWRGVGKELADGSDATDYVRKLRAEWEGGH